jgi:drug/metabolite transporter (DMT)-like permease/polyisoprenoid-binding protein YceI
MNSRPDSPSSYLPLAAALVAVVLWAAAFVGIRAAGRSFSPGALALGRLTIGTVLLGVLTWSRPVVRLSRRDLGLLVIAGLLWFGAYNVLLNDAERRVDAGTAAMLVLIAPIFIIGLAAVFLKERATPSLLLGGALAFAGVIVIGAASSTGNASLVGVILCLVAALASAIGLVAEKPVLGRVSALQATWVCCAVGTLFCLPYAPLLVRELRAAPAAGSGWLIFLGVFPTSIAFTTWAYALARGSAGRVAATAYLVPPIAIVMSWLILGEVPAPIAVLGGALCLVGVSIARRVPKALPLLVLGLLPATAHAQDSVVYRISPASRLEVSTGKAGLFGFMGHEHTIRARSFSGRIVYRPDSVAASRVEITVLTDSLEVLTPPDTEEIRKVTASMRTEILDVAHYPQIRLVSRQVAWKDQRLVMVGTLTIKDQTRDVPVTVELQIGRDTLRAVTGFAVKQTDFGIRPFRGGPGGTVRVADRVTFAITVVAIRQAP